MKRARASGGQCSNTNKSKPNAPRADRVGPGKTRRRGYSDLK